MMITISIFGGSQISRLLRLSPAFSVSGPFLTSSSSGHRPGIPLPHLALVPWSSAGINPARVSLTHSSCASSHAVSEVACNTPFTIRPADLAGFGYVLIANQAPYVKPDAGVRLRDSLPPLPAD